MAHWVSDYHINRLLLLLNCLFFLLFSDIQTHLSVLLTTLKNVVCQWMTLGVHLGVDYFALKVIKKNQPQDVEECMMEMLATWLKSEEGECNRDTLKTALQKINYRISE